MASTRAWPCSACAYWLPYPSWEGVGTCDNVMSRNYSRMAIGSAEHCESSQPRSSTAAPGGVGTCESCQYWLPFSTMPLVGQCDNASSKHFRRPAFSDKQTEECYASRSLHGLEFMWCQTHRETIHSSDLPYHGGCRVYPASAVLPVEDQMELTVAGD